MIYNADIYTSKEFIEAYTYEGDDLGAVWSKEAAVFKVWAPTADAVSVALYESGTAEADDRIAKHAMIKGAQGVWSVKVDGDLQGIYYTYFVTMNDKEVEANDPYARTTGVNGKRAMVLNPAATNPDGWEDDVNPHQGMKYTDAVIYELHIRDFSVDDSSGVSAEHRGKFLALTEHGTCSPKGAVTCLDYLRTLGITHLQLMPVYDYGSVDETRLDEPQFNWGYDPVNYNVPEGSYSTNPYRGEVRVREMKQMVKALHENGISVIMDVVYNHVFDADTFCFNKIVPGYFSRITTDGSYSNGSFCGNDTASERTMVRKYIVDSVLYWAEEYHIDGFRFDLVGLLDVETVNRIVETVHAKFPDVIFYGEGWTLPTTVPENVELAIQQNASKTPDFGYFSDDIRDLLAGRNGENLGFVTGSQGCEEEVCTCFMAQTEWCPQPVQTVNYVSCHDNYTLMDKLRITRPEATWEELVRMNKLAAAIYILAQGIPFVHAGEEFLRVKEDENGNLVENSYNSTDYVNRLRWYHLEEQAYADVAAYYKGLIAFRKSHATLRMSTAEEVKADMRGCKVTDGVLLFEILGDDNCVIIFNAAPKAQRISLSANGVTDGAWKVYIDGRCAGVEVLEEVWDDTVTVEAVSALVLARD